MTHIPHFNFPEFDRVATLLRERGNEVISPAELDDPEDRARAMASPDGNPIQYTYGKTHADFLARDLKIIADRVDAIVCLDGWEKSRGARVETFIGFVYGKPIYVLRANGNLAQTSLGYLLEAWGGESLKDLKALDAIVPGMLA